MIANVETRERTNSKGQTYPQWFDESGKMVGCGCDQAQAITVERYGYTPCKHRTAHNAALEAITTVDTVAHIDEEISTSCCTCGRYTRNIICYRCIR